MTSPSVEQLRRILHVIPYLADGDEHPIEEVARVAGIRDPRQLISDLQSLVERFDTPGGFVDGIQLCIESDTMSVFANHFLRPMRLTVRELCALDLGLAMLRSERPPDQHHVIDRTRDKLREITTQLAGQDAPSFDGIMEASLTSPGDRTHLEQLQNACRERYKVSIVYQNRAIDNAAARIVCPYGLIFANGVWYTIAYCERSTAMRFFRLDRIMGCEAYDEKFDVPPEFRLDAFARSNQLLSGHPITIMRVRYSARIARWIAERQQLPLDTDGSITIDHPIHDFAWAVRYVLQYGAEAEVLEPIDVREMISERLAAIDA